MANRNFHDRMSASIMKVDELKTRYLALDAWYLDEQANYQILSTSLTHKSAESLGLPLASQMM